MTGHPTGTTITIGRSALCGNHEVADGHPPLLRGEMAGSREDEPARPERTDDRVLEVSIPSLMIEQRETAQVLHVDDNPEYTDLTKTFLERDNEQLEVSAETSAIEGFRRLQQEPFDCIVADYEMPNTNGLEFLELVREQFPDIPFILFTGAGDEALASEAIAAGVTDYVRKYGGTEQYDVLANRVQNAVDRYRTQQQFWDALTWYQQLVEQDLAGVFLVQDGEFVYVNHRFADIVGRSPEALIGQSPAAVVDGPCDSLLVDALETDPGTTTVRREFGIRRPDGTTATVEVHGSPVECHGKPGCVGLMWDKSSPE